jgi:hypothetical protein
VANFEIDVVEPYVINVTVPASAAAAVKAQLPSTPVALVIPVPGVPGDRGPTGASGAGTQVFAETPSGVQDGVNDTFTLANTFQTGSTCVYRNGLREQLNVGYTEDSPSIVFTTAPLAGDSIAVDYLISAT